MHISKPLIITGCIAACIIAIAREARVECRREKLEKTHLKQFAGPSIGQSSYYNLATFNPGETAFFQDAYGYQWEISVQGSSAVHERHWMCNLTVRSENPVYLERFGDPHHGNLANLGMTRELQEGQGFDLLDSRGTHYPFPAIKLDTLRRSTTVST